ncbi:MAG: oligopeptide/dipeptide ABC transporter ATP-binding protein [Knoellia sp.]
MTALDTSTRSPMVEFSDLVKHFPLQDGTRFGKRNAGLAPRVVHAVDGISAQLKPGESLAIVGESGCGKSTVAKMLVGLQTPTSGTVRVGDQDVVPVRQVDLAARRRVQLISQSPWSALNRSKTVRHIVTQPLQVHGLAVDRASRDRRAAELMNIVGLSVDYLDRRPGEISGGELQRVTIARALAGEPEVLVLDEPTASLDVSVKAIVVNLLADLRRQLGLTYVLITHELDIARHLADHVAVMYLGEFVEMGPIDDVFDNPEHPYTRSLLAAAPGLATIGQPPAVLLKGEVPSAVDLPSGCRFHTRCPFATHTCGVEFPHLEPRVGGRAVACLRVDEVAAETQK